MIKRYNLDSLDSMKFFRYSEPYELLRWYQGGCWFDLSRDKYFTCPIPFNLIVRLAYVSWLFMLRPFRFFDAVFENNHLRYRQKMDRNQINSLNNYAARLEDNSEQSDREIRKRGDALEKMTGVIRKLKDRLEAIENEQEQRVWKTVNRILMVADEQAANGIDHLCQKSEIDPNQNQATNDQETTQ